MKRITKKSLKYIITILLALMIAAASFLLSHFKTDDTYNNIWDELIAKTDINYSAAKSLINSEAGTKDLSVSYIDVDQGDATLIRHKKYSILIDCGKAEYEESVYNFLNACGIKRLDMIIATHPDSDHIGGFYDLLNGGIKCDLFVMPQIPDQVEKTATEIKLINILKTMNIKTEYAVCGKQYNFGEMKFITYVTNGSFDDTNSYSIVTKIQYKDSSFLFMGDASKTIENEFISEGYSLRADILKVGHHGSAKSTSKKFLAYVKPLGAVISCGKDNSYGHPHREVIDNLNDSNIQYYRTDEQGTVIIGTDGSKYFSAVEKSVK